MTLKQLKRFRNETAGAAAIEFAIVVFPFLLMVGFLLQVAVMFYWTQLVEVASMQAARAIRSGEVQGANLSVEEFKTRNICTMFIGLTCNDTVVDVRRVAKTWGEGRATGTYSFINKEVPALKAPPLQQTAALFCPGGPGEMILVDVIYKAPVIFSWVWPDSATVTINGVQKTLIRWTSMVMNEPFSSKAGASC